MKKELKFVYKDYEQLYNIKNGLDNDYSFLEEIQIDKNGEWKNEGWLLFKQNTNNLLFILIVENTVDRITNKDIRVISKMRKLNKVNSIIYTCPENMREFLIFIKFAFQVGVVFFVDLLLLELIGEYIKPKVEFHIKGEFSTYFLFILTFLSVIYTSKFIWYQFEKTEVDIQIYNSKSVEGTSH